MIGKNLLASAILALPAVAMADVTLSIPLDPDGSVTTLSYSCGGGAPFAVQYVNTGNNSLALIEVNGARRIFVNVVAASGARYLSGAHEWWSKGDSATLRNEMEEGSAQECVSQPAQPAGAP